MGEGVIISDPEIMFGKATIKGTRLTVELILDKLAAGRTVEELLDSYPRLTREDISAALAYASKSVRARRITRAKVASS